MARALMFLLGCMLVGEACAPASAQVIGREWPERPITLVVPFVAGGAPDIIARFVATDLGERLGQKVVVENRPGASGNIGTMAVAKAPPDGYVLLLGTPNPIALNKLIMGPSPNFDPDTDIIPAKVLGTSASIVVTAPNGPKTLKELLVQASASPGKITGGVPGIGTSSHVALEYLMQATGTKFTVVPYRGAPSLADIVNGDAAIAINPTISYISAIKQGTLRALGVTSARRSAQLPDIPTLQELGLAGFEATTWYVIMAPAGTPDFILAKLNEAISAYLKSEKGQQMLKQFDVEAQDGSPSDARRFIQAEVNKWKPIVAAANIKM